MDSLVVGALAPDFTLPASGGVAVSLAQYRGKKVVLYFYPKDNTPGCTQEACEFRDMHPQLTAANAIVVGVSRDSEAMHDKFIAKLSLPFVLLSDKEETVCRLYDVLKEKNMYGKKVIGIERSTFIIDEDGRLLYVFRKVKAAGHAAAVLAALTV